MKHPIFALLAGLCIQAIWPASAGSIESGSLAPDRPAPAGSAELTVWSFDGYAPLMEIPEPSGMCFHPDRNTLFLVDDGDIDRPAGIYEINLQAQVLNSAFLGVDLEGICYCAADGMLYAADEIGERVYIVNPADLMTAGEFQVSRFYQQVEVMTAGGNGFEGIEYIPASAGRADGDYFLLLNQDDPHALIRIDRLQVISRSAEPVQIAGFWPLAEINTGELHYDQAAGELWVIHSWMNVVEILDISSMVVLRWEVFPGAAQEAVAVDGDGRLWIGYDLGGIARYIPREAE
jgi:uncharacterized protein YjiK